MFKQIGNNIKIFRKRLKMTQSDLAEKLNVTRQQIANYESGNATVPLHGIVEMSIIFNITIDSIVKFDLSKFSDHDFLEISMGFESSNITENNTARFNKSFESVVLLDKYMKNILAEKLLPLEETLNKILVRIDMTDLKHELGEELQKAEKIIQKNKSSNHS